MVDRKVYKKEKQKNMNLRSKVAVITPGEAERRIRKNSKPNAHEWSGLSCLAELRVHGGLFQLQNKQLQKYLVLMFPWVLPT